MIWSFKKDATKYQIFLMIEFIAYFEIRISQINVVDWSIIEKSLLLIQANIDNVYIWSFLNVAEVPIAIPSRILNPATDFAALLVVGC